MHQVCGNQAVTGQQQESLKSLQTFSDTEIPVSKTRSLNYVLYNLNQSLGRTTGQTEAWIPPLLRRLNDILANTR
jgi:hypothetical protein